MVNYTLIDLFAGAGGFSRGFKEANFRIVLAIENMEIIAEAYKSNFPSTYVLVDDIKNIHAIDILSLIGEPPDVIIGGPPCEPFTRANPKRRERPIDRLYSDPIGALVLHFIRIVGDLQPKVFVMENVPGIIEGELTSALKREFRRAGYEKIYFNKLYAEDYGTPSHRLRIFISNVPIKPKKHRNRVKVIDAIGDLPPPGAADIPNHEPIPLSRSKLKRVARLRWGEALIRYRGHGGRIMTNFIRLHPYRVAPTVMGSSRFIHPFEDRLLTVREHARLMGFPDDHIFVGGKDTQFNEVGEAVPVPLAKAIAEVIHRFLSHKE